jgi:hypothetical protein
MLRKPLQDALMLGIILSLFLTACGTPATPVPTDTPAPSAPQADLSGIKTYLLDKGGQLKASTADLKTASDAYYELAKAAGFNYDALWAENAAEARQTIEDARAAWMEASPLYEQMEGIVAGTPSLADYDVILDAGTSADEDPEGAVPFDLTLPDGRVLPKPGNLFGVTESTLWGTFDEFTADAQADWDGDGAIEFGEALPDADVLKAAADALDSSTSEMVNAASAWQPTESDAFTALVVMVPTMSEYFNSWKNSRFVLGEASTQRDFVAISRLSDIQNILGSLEPRLPTRPRQPRSSRAWSTSSRSSRMFTPKNRTASSSRLKKPTCSAPKLRTAPPPLPGRWLSSQPNLTSRSKANDFSTSPAGRRPVVQPCRFHSAASGRCLPGRTGASCTGASRTGASRTGASRRIDPGRARGRPALTLYRSARCAAGRARGRGCLPRRPGWRVE